MQEELNYTLRSANILNQLLRVSSIHHNTVYYFEIKNILQVLSQSLTCLLSVKQE
jgi:hypothetical protein